MTTLTETPDQTSNAELGALRGKVRRLTSAVIVLAVAFLALGAWVVYDYFANSESSVTGEVQTLLDDYTAAWNDHDGEAFLALVTDDYTFTSEEMFTGQPLTTTAAGQAMLIGAMGDFDIEVIGQPIMTGDGPWLVAQANRVTTESTEQDGISNFVVVDEGGTLLVASHIWSGN